MMTSAVAEAGLDVALADAVAVADVVGAVGVELDRHGARRVVTAQPAGQRRRGHLRVGDQRQVLPLDPDQLARRARLRLGLGHDERDLVAHAADDVGAGLGPSQGRTAPADP